MPVLVLEGDLDYAVSISETLRFAGHEVVTTGSVESARQLVSQRTPAVAILAVDTQDEASMGFCESLRAMFPDLPIMLLAAPGRSSSIGGSFARGADDYIVKPFHPGELSARVGALIRRAQMKKEGSRAMHSFRGSSPAQGTRPVDWGATPVCTQTGSAETSSPSGIGV